MVSAAAKSPPRTRVIGQEEVRRQLAESLRGGRAAHAYLLCGPDGIGKTAVALEFAQLLLCDRDGLTPCGECEQCGTFRSLQHPDLRIYFPLPSKKPGSTEDDEKEFASLIGKVISEQARDWYADVQSSVTQETKASRSKALTASQEMRRELRLSLIKAAVRAAALKPYQARRKVFALLEADMMNEPAQAALLKTLEEPYEESYFLLVTDNELGLRPTIRSRCQRVRMTPLAVETIYDALIAEGIPEPRAELAARLSGGSFNHAVDLSGPDIEKVQGSVVVFLRAVSRCNPLKLPEAVEELMDTGSLPDLAGLEMLGLFLRDAAMLRLSAGRASHGRLAFGHLEDKVQGVISAYPQANFEDAVRAIDDSVEYLTKGYTKDLILHALAIRLNKALGTLVRTKRTVASTHE